MLLPGCNAGSVISRKTGQRTAVHPAQIVGDLHERYGQRAQMSRNSTAVSCEASAAKKSRAGRRSSDVRADKCAATFAANCGFALMPVPTAVPPWARACSRGRHPCSRATPSSSCVRQAPISCPSVMGMASIRCVRPVLTVSPTSAAFRPKRLDQFHQGGQQCFGKRERRAQVDGGGDDVVAALAAVDVVVRMDRRGHAACIRRCKMCDDLVGIHVAARARARLEHVDRKLRVVTAFRDLERCALDREAAHLVELAEFDVGRRRSPLDQAERPDEAARQG